MPHHLIEDAGRLFAMSAAPRFCRGRHKHEWRRKGDQQNRRVSHRMTSLKKENERKNSNDISENARRKIY
jgi:hypothetical protein